MYRTFGVCLLAALTATGAAQATNTSALRLIPGRTTVAETMQRFGAPADTAMKPDGGLTLFYPGDRLVAEGGRAKMVALHFGPDFVYRDHLAIAAHDHYPVVASRR